MTFYCFFVSKVLKILTLWFNTRYSFNKSLICCLQLLYSDTFFSSPKIWQSGEPCHSSGAKFKRSWQGRERSIEWTEYSEFSTTAQLREGRSFQEVRLPRAHPRRHHGHSRLLDGLADAASTRINLQRGGRHRQERGARSRSSPQVPTFFVFSLSLGTWGFLVGPLDVLRRPFAQDSSFFSYGFWGSAEEVLVLSWFIIQNSIVL